MLIDVLNETLSSRLDSFVQETKAKPLEDETTNIDTHDTQDAITGDGVNALKEWTGKASATIVYDSTVDEFTDQGLFNKVRGKRNIALVVFTADGDVFGGFYNVAVTEQRKVFKGPDMFVFSFESRGRCETPQRFAVKKKVRIAKYVNFLKNNSYGSFINIGGGYGGFILGNEKSDTYCFDLSSGYVGVEGTTLTGKPNGERFTCTRLVAVRLQ